LKHLFRIARGALLLITTLWAGAVFAGPARCSYGNQDSTCTTPIVASGPAEPTNSCTGAGQTVATAPQWEGSYWSPGTCNYTPPPTCQSGQLEIAPPTWNGSTWIPPTCELPPPPWQPGQNPTDGMPYAYVLAYCAVTEEPSYPHMTGKPYPVTTQCTNSFAGAQFTQSGSGMRYWNTPTYTVFYTSAGITSGFIPADWSYLGMQYNSTGYYPVGYSQNYTVPSGAVLVYQGVQNGYAEAEGFMFACPSSNPNLNLSTFNAYADVNPSLIECN
jgi:hypothetical protein